MKIKKLPEAELEIMLVLWDCDEAVNTDYMLEKLHKDWTRSTLLNLLSRLEARGFVGFKKQGRFKMYVPKIKKEDYLKEEAGSFFEKLCSGSITGLVAALYDGKRITKKDLSELEKYIEDAK